MDSITYLPKPSELGEVFLHISETDKAKRKDLFKELADRVIEHSDQIIKIFEGEDHE